IALNKRRMAPSISGSVTTQEVGCIVAPSVTFTHTVNQGYNQMLIVTAGAEENGEDTSATYDGIPMSKGNAHGSGTEALYDYWYLVNPPQGTHDLTINFPGSSVNCRQYAALTLVNVDPITPFDTDGHVGGNGGN